MPIISDQSPVHFSDDLPEAVDVVIIGGGVAGTATAYYLAKKGVRVLVCEKGRIAGEQSSRNWGWVRQQKRDWAELPIMMESNRLWRGLAEETGDKDLTFTPAGYVNFCEDEASLAKMEQWYELAKQHQLDSSMLTADELRERLPQAQGQWVGGIVTESDGRAEPHLAVPALARALQRLGGLVIENCAARTLDLEAGRVVGVVTEKGRVRCQSVLLAGGAWSTFFASNSGIDLPQLHVRSTAVRTEPAPDFVAPNTYVPGLSIRRREDGGYTLSSGDLAEHYISPKSFKYFFKFMKLIKISSRDVRLSLRSPAGYPGAWGVSSRWRADEITPFERMRVLNPDPSPIVVERVRQRLPVRFPDLKGVQIAEAWAGMIDVTPDAVPYLCPVGKPDGLYVATGLSGHGFGIGPGVGRVMADLIQGRDPGHDLTRFRFNRFVDGSEIEPGPY